MSDVHNSKAKIRGYLTKSSQFYSFVIVLFCNTIHNFQDRFIYFICQSDRTNTHGN